MRVRPLTMALLLLTAAACGPPPRPEQTVVTVGLQVQGPTAFEGVHPGEVVNVTGRLKSVGDEVVLVGDGVRAVFEMREGEAVRRDLIGRVVTIRAAYEREDEDAHRLTDGRLVQPDPERVSP